MIDLAIGSTIMTRRHGGAHTTFLEPAISLTIDNQEQRIGNNRMDGIPVILRFCFILKLCAEASFRSLLPVLGGFLVTTNLNLNYIK
jgi:hypothetical protein